MKNLCSVCLSEDLIISLNLGPQPCSNRFCDTKKNALNEAVFPISFGYCEECETYQLVERMPIEAIRPNVDWLVYNEPESHLDETVKLLINDLGIKEDYKILGLTYKDQSTIDRFKALGIKNAECLEASIFEIENGPYGLESIQHSISNPLIIERIKSKSGYVDLLIVRHIIEHASSAIIFLKNLRKILNENGVVVLEIPDSEKFLENENFPFIWEEHISYFTEQSIGKLVELSGGTVVDIMRYQYPFEDSLIVAIKFNKDSSKNLLDNKKSLEHENKYLAQNVSKNYEVMKTALHEKLNKIKNEGGKIAIFGAGHLAVKTINFYDIAHLVEFVVDDNPHKVGKYMPKSGVKIHPTTSLVEHGITFCLSTLNPESEVKVRAKFGDFFSNGAQLISVFNIG